jgi:hypothetical protein
MAATLSSQFVKTLMGTGTGTEISGYLTSVNPVLRHDMSDQTTFTSGGNPVTENQIQGAIQSEYTFETVYDQTIIQALEPLIGSRTGTLFRFYSGSNALPTTGDGLFSGYYSIFGVTWNYNAGADVRQVWMLKIADGATTAAPSIGTV